MSDCSTEAFKAKEPHVRMTKTKSQLRAEAVERLRKLNCMDVDCYQLLEATVDDAGEKVGYRVEISKLIDLLTPDAHESRGSYEERLHDVPVSDCPYCGCKRVVIHDFSDIYEDPHSYRVEHVDEKEAFETGCFETYYAFDSAGKAVEHANMRDPLTDDETCPNSDGTCPDADGTPSIERSNDGVERSNDGVAKLDAQARAEIEDAERSANAAESHGDAQRAVLSADTDTDKGEGAKVAQDTREKLESDVRTYMFPWRVDMALDWLDRQASITERDVLGREWNYKDTCDSLQEQVDEYAVKVDALTAERDELKSKADALEADKASWQSGYHIDRLAKLQAQRDRYRDLLSKAVDEAQAIVKLMEVDS